MNRSEMDTQTNEMMLDVYKPYFLLFGELLQLILESPRGTPFTYGATPLDQVATLAKQEEIRIELQKLTYNVFDSTPLEIASYVHDTFSKRFQGRQEANNENFVTRLVLDYTESLDPILVDVVDRARLGLASPAELILVRDLLGIRSIELACLTHPYGERIEILDEMREVVHSAIELYDGEIYEKPETRYRIKDGVGDDDSELLINEQTPGLLMTRKRTIGALPDGTLIRERSSFVLRVDDSSQIRALLGDEAIEELKEIRFLSGKEQEEVLMKYKDIIDAYLDLKQFEEAIPVSTTIYAFNEVTAQKVYDLSEQRAIENEQFQIENNPEVDFTPTDEELRVQAQIDEERSRALNTEAINMRQHTKALRKLKKNALYTDPRIEDEEEAL